LSSRLSDSLPSWSKISITISSLSWGWSSLIRTWVVPQQSHNFHSAIFSFCLPDLTSNGVMVTLSLAYFASWSLQFFFGALASFLWACLSCLTHLLLGGEQWRISSSSSSSS
jgi:hypothetical protein